MPRLKALKAYQPSVASTPQATTTNPHLMSAIVSDCGPAESAEKLDAATATKAPAVRRHMNAAFFAKLSLLLSIGAAYFGFGAVGCSLLALSAAAIVTAAALAAEA